MQFGADSELDAWRHATRMGDESRTYQESLAFAPFHMHHAANHLAHQFTFGHVLATLVEVLSAFSAQSLPARIVLRSSNCYSGNSKESGDCGNDVGGPRRLVHFCFSLRVGACRVVRMWLLASDAHVAQIRGVALLRRVPASLRDTAGAARLCNEWSSRDKSWGFVRHTRRKGVWVELELPKRMQPRVFATQRYCWLVLVGVPLVSSCVDAVAGQAQGLNNALTIRERLYIETTCWGC